MSKIKALLGAAIAVLALSAIIVPIASAAEPEVLFKTPAGSTFPVTYSGSGGAAVLENTSGTKVSCTSTTVRGTIGEAEGESGTNQAHLGKVHILFRGCTTKIIFTFNCQNRGTGEILVEGVFHLGLALPGDIPAVLILPGTVEFSCEAGNVKVTGNVIGTINTTLNKQERSAELVFEQSGGKQKFVNFMLSLGGGEMANEHLTSEIFGSSAESGQSGRGTIGSYSSGTLELEQHESE